MQPLEQAGKFQVVGEMFIHTHTHTLYPVEGTPGDHDFTASSPTHLALYTRQDWPSLSTLLF